MRLTQIKLAGFKSFVDPTTLPLASNLTGVVGPNGCGKSNIIDAVRWVTGESNARHLRGDALEDVIFNGSRGRKPVGRAAVELRFDNSEGRLGGQYGAFGEISVRRELARDGGSKYFINNSRARRRDVVDLFLGTGLGGRSNYAVIEQGAVNRLIEARPEDMRQVFEEAAGISKYKERRRETENRIRHTRENLERLDDLISEVEQRLATLKRQARNAEKYKEFKADEHRLRAELLALRWLSRNEEAGVAEQALHEAEERLEQATGDRRQAESARDQAGRAHYDATAVVQERQAAFYDAQSQAERIEQSLAHAREVRKMRENERRQLVERLSSLEAKTNTDSDADADLVRKQDELQRRRKQAAAEFDSVREKLAAAELRASEAESEWDTLNASEHNPVQQLDAERSRARFAGQQRDALFERDAARRAERDRLPAVDDSVLAGLEEEIATQTQLLTQDREKLSGVTDEMETMRSKSVLTETHLAALRAELAGQQAALASARKVQQAMLREDDESIGRWLAGLGQARAEGVARRVRVREDWRVAAESALGALLQGFTVSTLTDMKQGAFEWPGESITLIESECDQFPDLENPPCGFPSLADGIEAPAAIRIAAANVFVVETLARALECREQLGSSQVFVTLDGCRVGPASLSTPPAESQEGDVFEREQRIAALDAATIELKQRVESAEIALAEQQAQLAEQRTLSESLDERIGQTRRHVETLRARAEGEQLRAEQTRSRQTEIDAELAELAEQRAQAQEQAEVAEARVAELVAEADTFSSHRRVLREQLAEAREARDCARSEVAGAQRHLGELDAELARVATRRETLGARREETMGAIEELTGRLEQFDAQADDTREAAEYGIEAAEAARQARAEAERDLRLAREALRARESELESCNQASMRAEQSVDMARESLQQARVDVEAANVRRQGIEEQLADLDMASADVAKTLPEEATEALWSERIETLEHKISRLGAINLAAIEECDEAAGRARYLAEQRTDLSEALETLEQAIAKIDRETRQRFKETFGEANQRFSGMFPELFGGGEAALELTEENWLTTGVRVMARPPGKRNASIQMLSGGEKTLTAVALLFALFELNPAPFCMLDEIDAPLDDTNVSRFCGLVRKMSAQVQFIVITHNKLTMELTEQLHGVTMAEPGVSRLVSVDIEQALDLAG